MSHRNKYLPLYIFLGGCFLLSIGYNIVLNEEIKLLQTEKKAYQLLEEHWFHKCSKLEQDLKFLLKLIDNKLLKNFT
jgi:hypothetical protein